MPAPFRLARRSFPPTAGAAVTWRELGISGPRDPVTRAAHADVVSARAQATAAILAALTLLWIPFDFVLFDPSAAWALAMARLCSSAALAALSSQHMGAGVTRRTVPLLYLVLLVFYLASLTILWRWESHHHAVAVTAVYVYLPFVMLAGMAIFPLTIAECAGLAMPWLAVGAIIGVVDNAFDDAFPLGVLWLLIVIGSIAAIAAVSQLQFLMIIIAQSSRDPLTEALTRRVGNEILAAHVEGARRRKAPLAVALMDLDHFKGVNDTHGHDAGDRMLASAGKAMRTVLRSQDSVIRWGGEEFVMLLPDTDAAGARRAIARLAVHGLGIRPDGSPQTACVGIAELNADALIDAGALVALADARMYRAKQAGRNRVIDPSEAVSMFLEQMTPRVGEEQIQPHGAARFIQAVS